MNNWEMFNECMIMVVMYYMLCFSDAMPDLDTQSDMGLACMGTVMFHIALNVGIMIF